jgi:hypothetical protein
MHAVNDPALRRPDDPQIVSAAASLQSQLLYYRLANYNRVIAPEITEAEKALSPGTQELYLALAAPCSCDQIGQQAQHFLLEYLRARDLGCEDSLSPVDYSVLFGLLHVAHIPQHRGQLLTKEIALYANRYLQRESEQIQLPIRRVGAILSGFGFAGRRRTRNGWSLVLEKEHQHRLHLIAERNGMHYLRDDMPGFAACPLCPASPPRDPIPGFGSVTA